MEWVVRYEGLTPAQVGIIQQIESSQNRVFWIKGFAGSGKTLLLLHLIKRFHALHPEKRCCFITYTHALTELIRTGLTSEEGSIHVISLYQYVYGKEHADLLVIDEVQDCDPGRLDYALGSCSRLIVAGDADQMIYTNRVDSKAISAILNEASVYQLTEIHRLTQKLARLAKVVLPHSHILEGSIEDSSLKRGADAVLYKYRDTKDETNRVWDDALDLSRAGSPSVIFFPDHDLLQQFAQILAERFNLTDLPDHKDRSWEFNSLWRNNNIPLGFYGNGKGSIDESDLKPFVYLMTYHSSKGLDFDNVFIPGLNSDLQMVKYESSDPELIRKLFFVAITRSRFNLKLSYCSEQPHFLIQEIINAKVIVPQTPQTETSSNVDDRDDDNDDFFF